MADLIKHEGLTITQIKYGGKKDLQEFKPFQRDILLFDTHVAGTSHIEGMEELEPHIKVGDRLEFFRQVDNPYDSNAIEVRNGDGVKLGYVPKSDNIIFSRLMDAGKMLYGKVVSKEIAGKWVKIFLEIYLHEL